MSTANKQTEIDYCKDITLKLLRKALFKFGTLIESQNEFIIKEIGLNFNKLTENPSKVYICIDSVNESKTVVDFFVSNFGIGPIQDNHCKSQLDLIINSFKTELNEYKREKCREY